MSCQTGCCKTLVVVTVLLAMAILAVPAFGQNNCLGDVSRANSCTAKDVKIAAVKQGTVNVFQGGIAGTNQCIANGTFSFTAEFEVLTSSSSTRSNIGIYFGTGTGASQNGAFSGTCTNAILAPLHSCANGTATCGDENYSEKDGPINGETGPASPGATAGCGDTASGDSSTDFGAGTHAAILEVDGATCPAAGGSPCPASSGFTGTCLALPTCSSWYQPANGMPVCASPGPNYPWVQQAIPGAPSKCTCGIVYVPVVPVTITPTVGKTCNTTTTTGTPDFTKSPPTPNNCDAGAEGSTVTYTVGITNPASSISGNNAVVDQICDNVYGTIYTRSGFTGPTCPTGATGYDGKAANVNCPPDGSTGIAPGATDTCTFTATVGENLTGLTDTVTAWGHSSLQSTTTFGGTTGLASNPVTVTSSDASSFAKTSKVVEATLPPANDCVTARFDATVKNTSAADEDINLQQVGTFGNTGYVAALTDSHFGDITHTHGSALTDGTVTGTTCGIATNATGSGTASNINGAGTFPQTLAHGTGATDGTATGGGSYTCQFDGIICGIAGPVSVNGSQVCASGIQGTPSSVSANLALDNSETGDPVTQNQVQYTPQVCFTASGQ